MSGYIANIYDRALDVLKIDADEIENSNLVLPLACAAPEYIQAATGLTADEQEKINLCYTVCDYLIQMWYNPDGVDTARMQTIVNSLLTTLKVLKNSK